MEGEKQRVNFLNVWGLPGVARGVIGAGCLRAASTTVMHWLFFYLSMKGLRKHSGVVVMAWSTSNFCGNVLVGLFKKCSSKLVRIPFLIISCSILLLLSQCCFDSPLWYLLTLIPCAMCLGGPKNTKITL